MDRPATGGLPHPYTPPLLAAAGCLPCEPKDTGTVGTVFETTDIEYHNRFTTTWDIFRTSRAAQILTATNP